MLPNEYMFITIMCLLMSILWVSRYTQSREAMFVVIAINMIGYILMIRDYKQKENLV